MNLRQAAEMALECLDYHWDNQDSELEEWPYVLEAKQALRQALAQPDLAMVGEVGVWSNKRDWVGMTDDERRAIGNGFENDNGHIPSWMSFARRIEAKLKEKNGG